ncbi:CapA family protein [Clostridium felsineum]|uniref:CapA family protein n=1 Tax=Clostridium felsineum TaxID=36839 RepID=UPI00214D1DBD|nr:CapA family protein [Clostridium felsineum]MCR3759914.1 CapA family protein [Clostridium felsineum]
MHFKIFIIKQFLRIINIFKGEKYIYSQEYEDNSKYMNFEEKLWWGYKALIRQVEHAQKGKNIEEYFKKQNLFFYKDSDFKVKEKVNITAGGDLSTSEILTQHSFKNLWNEVEEFFFSGDIICSNLETPLYIKKPMSGVPVMCLSAPALNTTKEIFECYSKHGKGINFFSTANNHSLDMGEEGLLATLDFLDKNGYKHRHVGTARDIKEQMNIPIIEKNGIRIAFLAYTYCLNDHDLIPGKEYMANVIRLNKPNTSISLIEEHIKIAHEKNADIIVAMLHWSIEFETYPIENVIKMGHKIIEAGVDIILGGHPHVVQPMEKYKFIDPFTKAKKEGFILYSFGELVSYNTFSKNSRLALLLKLEISKGIQKDKDVTKITGIQVLPIYTLVRKLKNGIYDYRLLDFLKTLSDLRRGKNIYCFTKNQIKEIKRLEKLLFEKILPINNKEIIYRNKLGSDKLC